MTKSFIYIGSHVDPLVLSQSQMSSMRCVSLCMVIKHTNITKQGITMATYISENPRIIRQFFCLKYWP